MRADKYFAPRFGSRTKAAQALDRGLILLDGKALRAKDEVKEGARIEIREAEDLFVSNGGYKLDRAIKTFHLNCLDKVFVDIGASTGGFTDCLLQNHAKKIYAVDVGESQLHEKLQRDPRVIPMDNTNARYLEKSHFPDIIDGVVTDVSFISLRLIFPVIKDVLSQNGFAVVLVKPQFECENKNIGKSGIVHTSAHADIVKKVFSYATDNGLYPHAIINAPVRKGKNIEYVLLVKPDYVGAPRQETLLLQLKEAIALHKEGQLR